MIYLQLENLQFHSLHMKQEEVFKLKWLHLFSIAQAIHFQRNSAMDIFRKISEIHPHHEINYTRVNDITLMFLLLTFSRLFR